MKECFTPWKPHGKTMGLIHLVNEIVERLAAIGYRLTLRQLFYQLVSKSVLPNLQPEYKRLGEILNSARLAGFVDWYAIEDRTRSLRGINHRVDPAEMLADAASGFHLDKWKNQPNRVEVWVEKDALVQVLQKACGPLDVDYFSCRGYTSQSALYDAASRLEGYIQQGQTPIIIHLGDHDPSGVDMTRDIEARVNLFIETHGYEAVEIERIALTMGQIRQYKPPHNPAKASDSRYKDYKRKHGARCWELDALDVQVIDKLITDKIKSYMDDDLWQEMVDLENRHRASLGDCAKRWHDVERFLTTPPKPPRKPRNRKASKKKQSKPNQP